MPVTVELIVDALSFLGGVAHIDEIVRRVLATACPPLPNDVAASVRGRLQERCAEAQSFKGGVSLFASVHGVAARQGIWRLRCDTLRPSDADAVFDGTEPFIQAEEGRLNLRLHLRRERSSELIKAFKHSLSDLRCRACEFDFEAAYGRFGMGYIEAHHIRPLSSQIEPGMTKLSDLVGLCANCHRVIHRNGLMPVEGLRSYVVRRRLATGVCPQ